MSEGLKIFSSCYIDNEKAIYNGKVLFENESQEIKPFLKQIYRSLKPGYAKFFKMDNISKLAFLAAEILLQDFDLTSYNPEEMSIILSNSDSTLDTDSDHQSMIDDYNNFYQVP